MSYQATWTLVLDGAHLAAGTCGSLPLGSAAAALLRPLAASLEALMLGASAAVILHEHACAARDDASAPLKSLQRAPQVKSREGTLLAALLEQGHAAVNKGTRT